MGAAGGGGDNGGSGGADGGEGQAQMHKRRQVFPEVPPHRYAIAPVVCTGVGAQLHWYDSAAPVARQ